MTPSPQTCSPQRRGPRARPLFALAAALAACATPTAGEKGGPVVVPLREGALASATAPRKVALVVGIPEVEDGSWRPLKYAAKDAADLGAALSDPSRGAFGRVEVRTGRADTTKKALLEAVKALAQYATRPEDAVVVYVSAHGTLARDERGVLRRYLVTRDARLDAIAQTALPVEALQAAFEGLPSRRRVLVLATCHSGNGKSALPGEVAAELASFKAGFYPRPIEEVSRASIVLSASDWGETAREDDALKNDIYTHYLVEAMSGAADRNGDGAVTATEAHDWARRKTFSFTQGRQRPAAEIVEVGADPVVLSGEARALGRPELFSYAARLDGFTVKIDGEERGTLPGGVSVPAGQRRVELTKGGAEPLYAAEVRLEEGERVDLEKLVSAAEPHRTVMLLGGAYGFVDSRAASQVFPATWAAGAALRWEGVLLPPLWWEVDAAGAGGRQVLDLGGGATVPFSYATVLLGLSAGWQWKVGPVSFLVGPRVAGLWLQRSFALDTYRGAQNVVTVAPGFTAGVALRLGKRWELSAMGQAMITFVAVDQSTQVLGFFGGYAGVGYRF